MHRRALAATLAAALLCVTAPPALAQVVARHFTQNTLRGDLIVQAFPVVMIDGRTLRMAPGARVMSDTDHLIQPASLTGQTVTVNYTFEATTGLVMQIWVLNAAELANTYWPHTPQQAAGLNFDWATQTWSRP